MCNFLRRVGAAVLGVTLLTACSPSLNWREMPAADGAVRVAFPARPHTETRELPVGEEQLPFTLTAASVDGAIFAVGHMVLPPELPTHRRHAYRDALEQSLARNLQAPPPERRQVRVHFVGHSPRPPLDADELELRGNPHGEPAWMLARVLVVGDRLIEVAAVGPADRLSREAARTFVDSLRVQ